MPETTFLVCEQCGERFARLTALVTYQAKKRSQRRIFCSRPCSSRYTIKENITPEQASKNRARNAELKLTGKKRDEFSHLRVHLSTILSRAKSIGKKVPRKTVEVTLADLQEQWNLQNGKCPYTGWTLEIKNKNKKVTKKPNMASLDRIDSSKGYIKGNIQFVSFMANMAKHTFHEDELIKFCRAVTGNYNDTTY